MSYFGSAVLLDEAARTDITRTLTRDCFYRRALHTGGWRVSVSPTLVEPSVATPGPCEGYNSTNLTNYRCGFDAQVRLVLA